MRGIVPAGETQPAHPDLAGTDPTPHCKTGRRRCSVLLEGRLQIVGVVSHHVEVGLIEIVVPQVVVSDAQRSAVVAGAPPGGGLDALADPDCGFQSRQQVGVRGEHNRCVIGVSSGHVHQRADHRPSAGGHGRLALEERTPRRTKRGRGGTHSGSR